MEERKLSSLFFGNVVLESGLMGTPVRIYSEDMRSYSFRPDSQTTLSVPLDELKGQLTRDHAEALARRVFDSVSEELDANYPGGYKRAVEELTTWLMHSD